MHNCKLATKLLLSQLQPQEVRSQRAVLESQLHKGSRGLEHLNVEISSLASFSFPKRLNVKTQRN